MWGQWLASTSTPTPTPTRPAQSANPCSVARARARTHTYTRIHPHARRHAAPCSLSELFGGDLSDGDLPPTHLPPHTTRACRYQDTVATARLDLVDKDSGLVIRVVATHQKGYQEDQLAQALAHAAAGNNADATLVCGDFNEEFSLRQWPMGYATLGREADLPAVSRPPHKVQKQVDYIFVSTNVTERVRALHIGRDDDSFDAILDSHEVCETGDMPSDHGACPRHWRGPASRAPRACQLASPPPDPPCVGGLMRPTGWLDVP